jgi:ERCC4-type nuclease
VYLVVEMKVIIDVRETALYNKSWLVNQGLKNSFVEIESKSLPLGDALLESDEGRPIWIVERKSLMDLLASIKDGRYEEQSYRLKNVEEYPRHNVIYIIEGMYSQLSSLQQKRVILSTMASLHYFKGFSVFRTCNIQETAELLVYMADKIDRKFQRGTLPYIYRWSGNTEDSYGEGITFPRKKSEVTAALNIRPTIDTSLEESKEQDNVEDNVKLETPTLETPTLEPPTPERYCTAIKKVKKENITKDNIGEIFLSQVPGISSTSAIAIMQYCGGSIKTLIRHLEESPHEIENIKIGNGEKKKRVSKPAIAKLKEYFLS